MANVVPSGTVMRCVNISVVIFTVFIFTECVMSIDRQFFYIKHEINLHL
jgi:hypothetical protein